MNRDQIFDDLMQLAYKLREADAFPIYGQSDPIKRADIQLRRALEAAIPSPVEDAELAKLSYASDRNTLARTLPRLIAEVERLRARPDVLWRRISTSVVSGLPIDSKVLYANEGFTRIHMSFHGGGVGVFVEDAWFAVVAPGKDGE